MLLVQVASGGPWARAGVAGNRASIPRRDTRIGNQSCLFITLAIFLFHGQTVCPQRATSPAICTGQSSPPDAFQPGLLDVLTPPTLGSKC